MNSYIQYNDYLSNTVGDSIKTFKSFSNPEVSLTIVDHQMSFRSDLNKDRIHEQAGYFSQRFSALIDTNVRSGVYLTDRRLDNVHKRLSKAYVYSAYKMVYYHLLYEESGINSLTIADPGYMFSGHLALLNLLGKNFTTCFDQVERVTLRKELTGIGSDSCKSIISDNLYQSFIQPNGQFFDAECERLFIELRNGYSSVLAISEISEGYYISGDNSPLGNMCVNSNGDNLIVTGYGSRHDRPSIYWNSALGITQVLGDEVGSNGSFYLNCGPAKSPRVIEWEVESITNLRSKTTPYPFEYKGSPGSGPNNPSNEGGSPRGNRGLDDGNRDNGDGYSKPTNYNNDNRGGKGSSKPYRKNRVDNIYNANNRFNQGVKLSYNRQQQRGKLSNLLRDSIKFVTSPGNLERSLVLFNQLGQISLTREQLRSIKTEAKSHSFTETNFESQKFGYGSLSFNKVQSNTKEITQSEGSLNLSFVPS